MKAVSKPGQLGKVMVHCALIACKKQIHKDCAKICSRVKEAFRQSMLR